VAGLLGLTVGCGSSSSKSKDGTGRADAGSKETPTLAARDEAVAAYKTRLDDVDKKIADLKDRAGKATGDEKTKLEGKLKDATTKREAVGKKVDELKAAAADKWEGVKKDTDAALEDLKKFVE
jgi:hypothetical protein